MAEPIDPQTGSRSDRFRREPPARDKPHRSASGFMQADRPFASDGATAGPQQSGSAQGISDELFSGVRLGYEVVDDYLRQARAMAASVSGGDTAGGSAGSPLAGLTGDMGRLADESVTYYRQMIETWMRIVLTVGQQVMGNLPNQGSTSLWGMDGHSPAAHSAEAATDAARAQPAPTQWADEPWTGTVPQPAVTVGLVVRSSRPASISFDLKPGADPARMAVHPLRSLNPHGAVISEVAFRESDGRVSLAVTVPENLAAGMYAGAIVDRTTGSACGVVNVEVE